MAASLVIFHLPSITSPRTPRLKAGGYLPQFCTHLIGYLLEVSKWPEKQSTIFYVVAFALQSSLANFASGILILLYRPFDVDDYVEISGIGGSVQSLNLLSVTIQTPDNKTVVISNNAVWGKEIVNYSAIENRRIDMMFGIGYEDDIEKAQRTLEEIVASHDLILEHPEPKIRLHELADSSVNFICRPWVKPKDYWTVYWDITKMVKERFDKEKLTIPYPQRDVHLHQT